MAHDGDGRPTGRGGEEPGETPLATWSRKRLASEVALLRANLEALTKGSPTTVTAGLALDTVRVPDGLAGPFLEAHGYVERYFLSFVHRPTEATISIAGERYILLRASSMSVEFVELVMSLYRDRGPEEARGVADNLLFDLAHALGTADALAFHEKMGVTEPIAKLSAGPIHFAFSGWASVEILPESKPSPDDDFFLMYDHPFSFESHSWIAKGKTSETPVCIMNAGYSSGWCEESYGLPLVATEIECTAAGGEHCRFIMAPPSRIEEHLARHGVVGGGAGGRSSVAVPEFFQRRRLEDELRRANTSLEQRVDERTAELTATAEQLRLLASAVENAVEGIVVMSFRGDGGELVIDSVNQGFTRVTGLVKAAAVGSTLDVLGVLDDERSELQRVAESVGSGRSVQTELSAIRPDGTEYALELHIMPADRSSELSSHWIGIFRDVTRRREHVAELRRQALHDALTDLPNRALLFDRLEQGVLRSARTREPLGLMVIDLDGFKEINDTFGHHAGDVLLRQVGPRLSEIVRTADTVARLGGDEFAILLPGIGGPVRAARLAKELLDVFHEPFTVEDQRLVVGASIGIVVCPEHGEDATTLLRRADVAMYKAKELRTGFEIYRSEDDTYSPARLALVGELRGGIERGELVLHYQPQISLEDGAAVRVEALVRWQHPKQGLLPPARFIPMIEPGNLVERLTDWVLDHAIGRCAEWNRSGIEVGIAVNVAPRSIRGQALPEQVGALLAEHGLDPARLTLEVTEGGLLGDPELALPVFQKLRDMGPRLSIDDFGTGYSSLAHLRQLPVDEIKIDCSFVLDMTTNEADLAIVRSTIQLGKNLGREVVAEGIERRETLDQLTDLGCELGQGFFIGRPMDEAGLLEWLAARAGKNGGTGSSVGAFSE